MSSTLGSHPNLSEVTQEALNLQRKRRLPIPLRLLVTLAVLIGIGTGLLLLPWMTTQPISLMDALFTATSAAAVTGLSVLTTSTAFTRMGQWVILLLMQFGGLGFLVTVVLTLRLMGRRISLVDRLAVSSSLGLANPKAILLVLGRTVTFMVAIEGVGALILWVHWRLNGIVPAGDVAFYALFHAVAAFCNAGFDLFTGLPQYPDGVPTDPVTLLTLGWLVIIGGLGIPVYMELLHRRTTRQEGRRLRRLSLQTRLALWSALFLILVGWAGLLIGEYRHEGVLSGVSLGERVLRAWFQSVAARTAGFAGLSDFANLHESSRLLLICLMFIGSAPASMGGGITTGTFSVLMVAMWSLARGYDRVRTGQRAISMAVVWRAITVLFISLGVILSATWLLLLTQELPLSPVLFEVVSAFSTTGLSLGITGQLDTFGRLVLIGLMFWGRLGAITIMLILLKRRGHDSLLQYPEETVLVG
ncbi:MAG: potassium transporter [Anaerolineae bacterium]|nr:potassium transporter [Anaerolineae bacterium]